MNVLLAAVLTGAMMAQPASSPGAQSSTASPGFADRAARLEARITQNQARRQLAPGQDALLRVQLDATRRAYAAHDPAANQMLDVIDRQLAQADHLLSRAENGRGIIVHVGETVMVAMYDQYFWNVENSDPTVLAPKIGVMWARGVQGGFTAKQPGTAILTLTPKTATAPDVKQPVEFTITILPNPR